MGLALSGRHHYTQKPFSSYAKPKGNSHSRGTLKNLITCHNSPQEQEGTKKEVSCLCPKAIHDLPLADGEGNTKNLQTKAVSRCTIIIKQPKQLPSFTEVSEHTGQPSCWPSEAEVWL